MDKDALDLVLRLCAVAGMIMEDASLIALVSPDKGSEARTIREVRRAGLDIAALADAAEVIARRST